MTLALREDAVLIATKGELYLFESRLPVARIDADDAPLPTPRPPSLRDKLDSVSHEIDQIRLAACFPGLSSP